ncbi:MAG: hypothetical protein AB1646_09095 [Thermodesulfobacteriota bacterium]
MSFSKELAEFRTNRRAQIPPESLAVIDRAIEDLRNSGILEKCLTKGDAAPDFTGQTAQGEAVELSRLLAHGSVVLSFYRGGW